MTNKGHRNISMLEKKTQNAYADKFMAFMMYLNIYGDPKINCCKNAVDRKKVKAVTFGSSQKAE